MLLLGSCDDSHIEGYEPGQCSDRADNDGDGFYDCDDSDCTNAPVCQGDDDDTLSSDDDDSSPPGDDDDSSPPGDDDDSGLPGDDDDSGGDDDDSAGDDDDSAGDDDDSAEPEEICASIGFPGIAQAAMSIDWDNFGASASPPLPFEFWLRLNAYPPNTANAMLLQTRDSNDPWSLQLVGSVLNPCGYCPGCLMLNDSGGITCTDPPPLQAWSHLAITIDGAAPPYAATLFRDGELIEQPFPRDNPGDLNFSTFNDFWLGFSPQNNALDGDIAKLRISEGLRYTGNFTPETSLAVDSDTLGFWPGNDGTGTVVTDLVGNHDAQLVGATNWSQECLPIEGPIGDDDDSAACDGDWEQTAELTCDDGCDNDENGLTDCSDPACEIDPLCDTETGGNEGNSLGDATQSGPGVTMPLCCEPDPSIGMPNCSICIQHMAPPPVGCGTDPDGWVPNAHVLSEGLSPCCGGTGPLQGPMNLWANTCPECDDGLDNDGDGLIDCDEADCVNTVNHFQVPGLCGVPP